MTVLWDKDFQKYFAPVGSEMPVPAAGIFDPPVLCARFNAVWYSHILGAVGVLGYEWAWEGTDEEKYAATQEIAAFLADVGECEESAEVKPPDYQIVRYVSANVPHSVGDNLFEGWQIRLDDPDVTPFAGKQFQIPQGTAAIVELRHVAWDTDYSQVNINWTAHTMSGKIYSHPNRVIYGHEFVARGAIYATSGDLTFSAILTSNVAGSAGLGLYYSGWQDKRVSTLSLWWL